MNRNSLSLRCGNGGKITGSGMSTIKKGVRVVFSHFNEINGSVCFNGTVWSVFVGVENEATKVFN